MEPAPAKAGGCRGCEGAVVQAPAPERPLTGGIATKTVLAQLRRLAGSRPPKGLFFPERTGKGRHYIGMLGWPSPICGYR